MIAALLIVFREVLEAGLVIGIVLAATAGVPGRSRSIALGVGLGVAGACVIALFADQISRQFEGAGQELLQASVLIVAVGMLAWHNAWMASHGRQIAQRMKALGRSVSLGDRPPTALAVVCGVAVLREGSEVVLFLAGVAASSGASALDLLAGGALGIALGAAVALLIYRGLLAIPAGRLLNVTGWMITLLAAGMASRAVVYLQQAGYADTLTTPLWDTSWLLADSSMLGRAAQTLIGYSDQPNGLQLLVYAATVLGIWALSRFLSRPPPARVAAAE